jgi:hypothetical protein
MSPKVREALIRKYASGEMSWHDLRAEGVTDYYDVLAELGRLSLKPPVALMSGPNVAARERGLLALKALLKGRK